MLNKLSYNLANSLNESESEVLKVSKRVLIESDGVKTEAVDPAKEERLASLKMQIEKDGAQLAADEKEAIEKEVAELEKEVYNEAETLTEEMGDSTFTLTINTSNEVFEGNPEVEVARILNDISNNLEYTESKKILDVNGNVVGKYGFGFEGVSLGEAEDLKEEYSEKLGGDPEDFITDVSNIRAALNSLLQGSSTYQFGTHLAQQMVEDWIDICDRQIEKGKRLASGDEFYTEGCSKQKIEETTISEVERVHKAIENAETEAEVKEAILSISDNRLESEVLSAFNQCIQDEDDLDALKDHVLATLEDNAIYNESEELTEAEEVEVKNLQVIKEQGNVYMLEDENKKMIVGENYNADEGIIENAEIYENKEEADKDYLSRCDIIKDGEEFKSEEPIKEAEEGLPAETDEKVEKLKKMDSVARSFNDEELFDLWLAYGVVDEADEDDYINMAMNDFEDIERVFTKLIKNAVEEKSGLYNATEEDLAFARQYNPDIQSFYDEGIIDDLKLNHRVKKADKASERYDTDKSKRNKKKMNKAFNKLDAEKERQIKKHQDKINKIKKA